MTDDEIKRLKTINGHLRRRGFPPVKSISEFYEKHMNYGNTLRWSRYDHR